MINNYLNNKWFVMLLLLPFFVPMALQYIPTTLTVYDLLQILKLVIVIVVVILYFLECKFCVTYLDLLVIVFGLLYVLTSFISGADYSKPMTNFLISLLPIFLVRIFLKKNPELFLKCFTIWNFFSLYLNFFCSMIFQDGLSFATLYTNKANPLYLYSIDNGMGKFLIMPIFLSFIHYLQKKNKILLCSNILVAYGTILISNSATGLCVITGFILLLSLSVFYGIRLKMKYLLFFVFFFEIGIVVLGNNFGWIHSFTEIIGRNADFTGRDYLWSQALQMINNMPWFGYGYSSGILSVWGAYYSSHNLYLELCLHGGPFLLIVFCIMLLYAIRKNKNQKIEKDMISLAIVCFLIIGLFEVGINPMYYFFLAFSVYGLGLNPKKGF